MKHCIIGFLGCVLALPMAAQETYQNTRLLGNDLNGTARYVGMGGAMEALGADISTISTNPAGLGLFRKGQVTLPVVSSHNPMPQRTHHLRAFRQVLMPTKTN